LARTDFAALPLRIFLQKSGKFGIGHRRFVQLERFHGDQRRGFF